MIHFTTPRKVQVQLLFLICAVAGSSHAQKVGIETSTPDSTLSIQNKVEIGGNQGDVLFTDDLGSITFPSSVLPNAPMIHMFSSGHSNADRMVFAHSPGSPTWGLQYRDNLDEFRFGVAGGSSAVSIGVGSGHMAIGQVDVVPFSTLIASTTNDLQTASFYNTNTSDPVVTAVYASVSGNASGTKRAGLFEALQGSGRTYGMYATSALADTNIAIYGSAGYIINSPTALQRAAWFDDGDVVVDDQMLIGSTALYDIPAASALLELRSTDKGLLLPRMTASQRQAITTPDEGLIVFDTDSSKAFLRSAGNWSSLSEGGGSSTGLWTYHGTPSGPFVGATESVGVGVIPQFFRRMSISSSTNLPYALEVLNTYSGGLGKYGLYVETNSAGTNTRYGIYSKAWASTSDDTAYGIYAEGNQGTTAATVYGIYAKAPGTGSGDRWAGYFEGNTTVEDHLQVIDGSDASFVNDGYLQLGENAGPNLIMDDNEILVRDNGSEANLFLQRDAGDLLLCALANGQVGIGISDPLNLPDPEYLLAVDGKAIMEAVRVELSGAWPDYVFASDYELGSIEDLDTQIKSLGHLPGMPSAKTVREEGIDLGEMQVKLLEKIEELTLHLIAQNKTISALQDKVAELHGKLNDK